MRIMTDSHSRFLPERGEFALDINVGGELVEQVRECNLIVDQSIDIRRHLLGGAANYAITQIGFGVGTAAPAPGNTVLTSAFMKGFTSVSYQGSNVVVFNFALQTSEANGIAISEFGLLTSGGLLYARKVRGTPINKTSAVSLTGSWAIII